jgi:arginine:ornithine antiporter / lysine permease
MATDVRTEAAPVQKLTFITMTAMVVGSMVGVGVFSLPRRFAEETGVTGALIAWLIAGTGMLMLAFVFLSVLAVFASVTIVSYGILPYSQIADLRQPSMAGVLEAAVGQWGKAFVSVGLIVSVLGAYLAWTLMAAEVLFVAAKDDDMPRFLGRTRRGDVPFASLLLSTILIQVMLVVTLFSEDAFNFALDLTSALTLIPFLLAAAYAVKLALTREQHRRLFSPAELVILTISVAGAIGGIVALATGWISI